MSSVSRLEAPPASAPEALSGVWRRSTERKPSGEVTTFALHDAKNMVCALQVGLEWLKASQHDAESVAAIEEMTDTCNSLTKLLLEALQFTRSGNSELELRQKPESVAEVVESVAFRLRGRALRAGVNVVVECHSRPTAVVDHALMTRVLENLTENALRVSPTGSQLTLGCGTFGENAVITVTDHGPGVHPLHQEEIFELYASDEKSGGTGIGLAFCRRVVVAHGGSLTLDSLPGEGATFVISLPLAASE